MIMVGKFWEVDDGPIFYVLARTTNLGKCVKLDYGSATF